MGQPSQARRTQVLTTGVLTALSVHTTQLYQNVLVGTMQALQVNLQSGKSVSALEAL